MKLSARSRYAARILLELAKHDPNVPMSAMVLSYRTGVSVQFVEQILKPLKQKGLTTSVRGAAGGHKLARRPQDITLGEVVALMEGGINLTVCCEEKSRECPRRDGCLTHQAWRRVSQILQAELDSISLASLLSSNSVCVLGDEKVHFEEYKKAKATRKRNKPVAVAQATLPSVRKIRTPIARRIRIKTQPSAE